jgi:hypothetical protein
MMHETETFWTLCKSAGHWDFEIFLMILFDGIIGALLFPWIRKHWQHHVNRDQKDGLLK